MLMSANKDLLYGTGNCSQYLIITFNEREGLYIYIYIYIHGCSVASVTSNSLLPCGLQPARLLSPWDSPSKNTGMGCIHSSRGSSRLRDWTHVSWNSCIAGRFFAAEPLGKPPKYIYTYIIHITELHCCKPKTNTALQISYISIKFLTLCLQPQGSHSGGSCHYLPSIGREYAGRGWMAFHCQVQCLLHCSSRNVGDWGRG